MVCVNMISLIKEECVGRLSLVSTLFYVFKLLCFIFCQYSPLCIDKDSYLISPSGSLSNDSVLYFILFQQRFNIISAPGSLSALTSTITKLPLCYFGSLSNISCPHYATCTFRVRLSDFFSIPLCVVVLRPSFANISDTL